MIDDTSSRYDVTAPRARGLHIGDNGTQVNIFGDRPEPAWPIGVGRVPPLADCWQLRPDEQALLPGCDGQAVVLTQVLSGMGGVGKTQLAAGWATTLWQRRSVDLLLWVDAGSRQSIAAAYAQAATACGADPRLDSEPAAQWLLRWLADSGKRWAVVLDDLTRPADLTGLWPPATGTGSVVVTTRRSDSALRRDNRVLVQVGLFTPTQAHEYLAAKLKNHPSLADDIAGLGDDLGHLPLALAQAAAYMIDRDMSCGAYRRRLADRRRGLEHFLPEPESLPDEHRATVAATWSLSIEHADTLRPAGLARPLLRLASLLDPNGVPALMLTAQPVLVWLSAAAGVQVTADDVRDAVRNLHLLSLATHDPGNPARSLRVHALIQRATHDQTPPGTRDSATLAAADALQSVWPDIETDADLGQALRANTEHLHHTNPDPLWTPDSGVHAALFTAGTSLGEAGQVTAAADYYQRLHQTAHQRLGPDHPDTLTTRNDLADWIGQAGDAGGAVTAFEQLLADRLRVLGPAHPHTLNTRHNVARWRGHAGDAGGAVTAFEQVLVDDLRILGPDHPDTLTTRNNLAYWRGQAGDPAGAVTAFEQQLADFLRLLGPDHPHTLTTRNNLAHWRGQAGDADGAVTAFEQVLADRLRVLGPDHPQTLNTRNNLALWRGQAGDPAGAVTAFEELLADRLRVLGPNHPDTLTTRSNLADWRGQAGDADGAVTAFEQVLADRLRLLGPDHPHTLTTRNNLAHWRGKAGDADGAVTAFEELLADRLQLLGPDHPHTLATRNNLAHWRNDAAGNA
ncbi:FxSxx-COOH system tetratricopeptide repeat protein [Catellatospora sp. NPDC049111]|uniref:FxSxx-COOH system tetratricopeptide repeat protein n=1 Tax=Catellatospora sp. NPDC049111 TaxID=3155271 RepID=UPI0033F995CA